MREDSRIIIVLIAPFVLYYVIDAIHAFNIINKRKNDK